MWHCACFLIQILQLGRKIKKVEECLKIWREEKAEKEKEMWKLQGSVSVCVCVCVCVSFCLYFYSYQMMSYIFLT